MALGKMYAIKPPLQFTEGRDWDRILNNHGRFNSALPVSPTLLSRHRWVSDGAQRYAVIRNPPERVSGVYPTGVR